VTASQLSPVRIHKKRGTSDTRLTDRVAFRDTYTLGSIAKITPATNIHSVTALEDAIFFDVLAPPYDIHGGRSCNYYKLSNKILLPTLEQTLVEEVPFHGPFPQ
jgi:hypothetical protein